MRAMDLSSEKIHMSSGTKRFAYHFLYSPPGVITRLPVFTTSNHWPLFLSLIPLLAVAVQSVGSQEYFDLSLCER